MLGNDQIVTEWTLKADQFKGELKTLGRETQAFGHMLGNIYTAALGSLQSALSDVVKTSLKWEDLIGSNGAAVERLSKATGGLVSSIDLARASNKLHQGDLNLSEKQMEDVARVAIKLGRNLDIDFSQAMDKATDIVQKGGKGMKALGEEMEFTGSASEKSAAVLKKFGEIAKGVDVSAQDAGEAIDRLKGTFEKIVGPIGTAIIQSDLFKAALKGLQDAGDLTANVISALTGRVNALSLKSKLAFDDIIASTQVAERTFAKIFGAGLLTGGKVDTPVATALKSIQDAVDKSQKAAADAGYFPPSSEPMGPPRPGGGVNVRPKAGRGKAAKPAFSIGNEYGSEVQRTSDEADMASYQYGDYDESGQWQSGAEYRRGIAGAADAIGKMNAANAEAKLKHEIKLTNDALAEQTKRTKETADAWKGLGDGALQKSMEGIVDSIYNAAMGTENLGAGLLKLGASIALSIAKEAPGQIIKELALGAAATANAANPFHVMSGMSVGFATEAAMHYTSAAIWGGIGAAGLGVGIGLGYAGNAASSTGKSGSAGGGASRSSATDAYRPSYGKKSEDNKPIVVQVYVGDSSDPGAILFATKQVETRLAKAA